MAIPKRRAKNLALQQLHLLRLFPDSDCRIQRSELRWEHDITPTDRSDTYRVRITYKLGKPPRVEVLSPKLQRRNGKLPHVYPGERLCLYLPGIGEWGGDQLLATTIVPWASEWLAHYEDWLFTGVWHGGGTHPGRWDGDADPEAGGVEESGKVA